MLVCLFVYFAFKRKQMKRKWSEYSFKREKSITEKRPEETESHETLHIIYPFTAVFLLFFCFFFFYLPIGEK